MDLGMGVALDCVVAIDEISRALGAAALHTVQCPGSHRFGQAPSVCDRTDASTHRAETVRLSVPGASPYRAPDAGSQSAE